MEIFSFIPLYLSTNFFITTFQISYKYLLSFLIITFLPFLLKFFKVLFSFILIFNSILPYVKYKYAKYCFYYVKTSYINTKSIHIFLLHLIQILIFFPLSYMLLPLYFCFSTILIFSYHLLYSFQ